MIILKTHRLYRCQSCDFQVWYLESDMRTILNHQWSHLFLAVKEA